MQFTLTFIQGEKKNVTSGILVDFFYCHIYYIIEKWLLCWLTDFSKYPEENARKNGLRIFVLYEKMFSVEFNKMDIKQQLATFYFTKVLSSSKKTVEDFRTGCWEEYG